MRSGRRLRDSFDAAEIVFDQQIGRRSQQDLTTAIDDGARARKFPGLAVFSGLSRVSSAIRQMTFRGNRVALAVNGDRVTVTVSGAPETATYIVQAADPELPNAQSLGALATGILKNTTGTGVLSIATGSDLPSHTHSESDVTNLVTDLAAKANKTDNLSVFAATTSLQLKGVISDETGSGALVFGTSPAITTPTGIVKGDVGLGNVDNTSDATKNAAAVILTNKTITAPAITGLMDIQGTVKATGTDPAIAITPVGTYPAAGTTPGAVTINGSDTAMVVSFQTGTTPAAGALFKVTFAAAKASTNYAVFIQPMTSNDANLQPFYSRATSDFTVSVKVAPPASTTIRFALLVIETP